MSTATQTKPQARSWTCQRCEVTSTWLPGQERDDPPAGWTDEGGEVHCLACRRAIAADAGPANAAPGTSREDRAKLRTTALIEFEIRRDPERSNGEIAKVARCSVPAVLKARRRLESALG